MNNKDDWSQIIESTHCILCGIFSFSALCSNYFKNYKLFYITLSISMGTINE